jgi:hypothetical protein
MIQTGFESKVKIQQIIDNQLPEFILDENPKTVEFLKQYYISQEYQGGPVDIVDNLDQYLKLDNLTPEVIVDSTHVTSGISSTDTTIAVNSTKGFPGQYGLFKINNEVITYTGITTNSFTGCQRGFSGITSYHSELNQEELVFSDTSKEIHAEDATVYNLSSLFLRDFYKKLKYTFAPGLEDVDFAKELNAGNFIKEAKSFYQSKGTDESFRILFNVLYGATPRVVNLEDYLIKPSSAEYLRREVAIAEVISGDPSKLVGQTITKSTDSGTTAAISEIEPFTRNNKQYFKLSLFIGYDESSTIQGNFNITPSTKNIETVAIGASVITVDSTIGFAQTGMVISGINSVTYSDKTINQFIGCTGVASIISSASNIRSDEIYFGYEDGDSNKRVEIRLTGVLSNFIQVSDDLDISEGDIISVNNIGDLISNPSIGNGTYKEIFANSWIYNTSSSYEIKDFGVDLSLTLKSETDKSSLKEGDSVEIIESGDNNPGKVVFPTSSSSITHVVDISPDKKSISLDNFTFSPSPNVEYSLRRKINKARSTGVPIEYGNSSILGDIQNVYTDSTENFGYVASNSLPSSTAGLTTFFTYEITKNINSAFIDSEVSLGNINQSNNYTTITFSENAPFLTGDRILYKPDVDPLEGLVEGSYFVEVLASDKKTIRLYNSSSFIGSTEFVTFSVPSSGMNKHTFTLFEHRVGEIGAQKLLKKFPISPNNKNGKGELTIPGTTGMLINGVEVANYKSGDKIYYGPLNSITVLNGGSNYDVINLPQLLVSAGLGTTALCRPVIRGSIERVDVDIQNFDIDNVTSIEVTGGNGTGADLKAIVGKRVREVNFDGQLISSGGGIDNNTNQITFLTDHNFSDGQEVIYDSNKNTGIGVGIGTSSLVSDGSYFIKVDNNTTVQLFESYDDYSSNNNIVGLSTLYTTGIHKFKTKEKTKTISSVDVINGGSGYTNRKLIVSPTGITTSNGLISFKNHGFADGDLVLYSTDGTSITGLTTSTGITTTSVQYQIIKVDDNSFKVANAGVGGTSPLNYERNNFVKLSSTGVGYQNFAYPDISVSVEFTSVGVGTTVSIRTLLVTPLVKGSIIDAYIYEAGTGYGSSAINFEKKPLITLKNGKNAQLKPIIVGGIVNAVNIQFGGSEYFSVPDLEVIDSSGSGSGASLRPVISTSGKITDVKIINTGIGYSSTSTSIRVVPSGSGVIFDTEVRSLSVNNIHKYGNEILKETKNKLQYSVSGYYTELRSTFKDVQSKVSGIIGWAYDGNPIYGPYANSDVLDTSSGPIRLESGYIKNSSRIIDRPSGFDDGFFIEDYEYTNSGNLDRYNGRFTKTVDFPNGVYAYFATIDNNGKPQFPYFIGDKYRTNTLDENKLLNQEFNFQNSNLLRNTFPYKVSDPFVDNDFLIETNEISRQKSVIESITEGPIEKINILNSGIGYKVNDSLNFDSTGTNGDGVIAKITSILGKNVYDIQTSVETYDDAIFTWNGENGVKVSILPQHNLRDKEYVTISGFSSDLSQLNNNFQIGISSFYSNLSSPIVGSDASPGAATTEIYVSQIPGSVSVGSSVGIGSETLQVLNIFPNLNILRVKRGLVGTSHTATTKIEYIPDSFTISKNVNYFESLVNDKAYFNPKESVGVGITVGISSSMTFEFGDSSITRDVLTQRIYIENHPFITNQPVNLIVPAGGEISISNTSSSTPYDLPISGVTTTVYIVRKTINSIGIKTGIGTEFKEVFFRNNGTDSDEYLFETINLQKKSKVQRINSVVSISTVGLNTADPGQTYHKLSSGDKITLNVQPKIFGGIGTDTSVIVKRDTLTDSLIVNPITIDPSNIDSVTNQITINSHKLETGQKVSYAASLPASGLSTGSYYVYRINDDIIQLSETYINSTLNPPTVVSIANTGGGTQTISPINPKIEVVKNNSLVFDLSDSTLDGYLLKIYCDNQFNNEFVSTGSTSGITIAGVGTVGVSANAKLTLNYNTDNSTNTLPEKLYYNLEKSGYISTADAEVNNYSEIAYIKSSYNSTYPISGIGETTFNVALNKIPEKLSYESSECSTLEYSTTSLNADGPIEKINIVSGGSGYKKLPNYVGSSNTTAKDANLIASSKSVGNTKNVRIINEGFEYSSDRTLQPKANIPAIITIKNSNTIGIVTVIDGGKNYTEPPRIVIVDTGTGQSIDRGILAASVVGNSINSIDVLQSPKGLPDKSAELFTVENTNGISIQRVIQETDTRFVCRITTPALGFSTSSFSVGEKVFIEGIQKVGVAGSGFNSEDYGYKFFTVTEYKNSKFVGGITQDEVTIDLSEFTTNIGTAKTIQDSLGNIIKKSDYPTFEIVQEISKFTLGEKLSINGENSNLIVSGLNPGSIKISGDDNEDVVVGDILTGQVSSNIATIDHIVRNNGRFEVSFSNKKRIGWDNNIGRLSSDDQVIPDNDYYQNLSYTVKSPIEWREFRTPVNSLVHTSGLKNFGDLGISSTANVGIGSTTAFTVIRDLLEELRVDTIYNFDNVLDIDVIGSQSKFLKLQNKKLTDYTLSKSNVVLKIDDISNTFSNLNNFTDSDSKNLFTFNNSDSFDDVLVRVTNTNNTQVQLAEFTIISDNSGGNFLLEKGNIANIGSALTSVVGEDYGSFSVTDENVFKFTPNDPDNIDYDFKFIKNTFGSAISGVGTTSIGFINLTGFSGVVTSGGSGITSSIIGVATDKFTSLHVNTQIIQSNTNELNFVELYITHNGTDTFLSEYYFDTNENTSSFNFIGSFGADISSGVLNLNYTNDTANDVQLRSKIVGFGTTSVGVGTYRFILPSQPEGVERSAIIKSAYETTVSAAATTVISFDRNLFNSVKSLVEVSMGSTKAVHNVLALQDNAFDNYVQQSSFLSAGGIGVTDAQSGMGTFGVEYSGENFILKFYPDAAMTSSLQVSSLNEIFYTNLDSSNTPPIHQYGDITQSLNVGFYNALNGNRIDKTDFIAQSNGIPIFGKTFNPTNSLQLNLSTGVFTIDNHFFRTGEALSYTPQSTFVGVGSTAMTYGTGTPLPSVVYAIRENDDEFKLATTRANAEAGVNVSFGSSGEGNAHELSMLLGNEKTLITLDSIAQYPLKFTPIAYTLSGNPGGQIGTTSTFFSLSGISSITPTDLIKINDEYMKILSVGVGTTAVGPITGIGQSSLVEVKRGVVGSSATSHSAGDEVRIYRGSYNISGRNIHFVDPPKGNTSTEKDASNLEPAKADFTGRVYLRNNYDTNQIYDDISDQFTGIGATFTLTVGGANTTGIGSTGGNGILFINGIFQTPSTLNNPDNNFSLNDEGTVGVTSVTFSGITSTDGTKYLSNIDYNANQLPRGGVIVSLGSSGGFGYAPLLGAEVLARTNHSGAITSIIGIGTTGKALSISTATYSHSTGLLEVTTTGAHGFEFGVVNEVTMVGLEFACAAAHAGVTTTIFPDITNQRPFSITGINSTTTFTADVGISTIPHDYVGQGTVFTWYGNLTHGAGYNDIVAIGVSITDLDGIGNGANITAHPVGVNTHLFVSASANSVTRSIGGTLTVSDAEYAPDTGVLTLTFTGAHGLTASSNTIQIADNSLIFTCAQDMHQSIHPYPRSTDPAGGGTALTVLSTPSATSITVNVGASSNHGGGALTFNINAAGSNYSNPKIFVSEPTYEGLETEGISRLGFGNTTITGVSLLVDIGVGAATTSGIGSDTFEVSNFKIARNGYGFRKGDIIRPVGLVTNRILTSATSEFLLTVDDVYNDSIGAWQFGEFDYIDSIKNYQDSSRTRFPLFYNDELISFEAQEGTQVNLANALLIVINGIIQDPEVAYFFEGGTSFSFIEAPKPEDNIDIFFYRGSRNDDDQLITNINQTIKRGDLVQVYKNNAIDGTISQDKRTVFDLSFSDKFETNLYSGNGIDEINYKPLVWTKQKIDKVINGEIVYKSRDSIEAQVFPTAKIINTVESSDTEVFVENLELFDYDSASDFSGLIVGGSTDPVAAAITATVSTAGTITGYTISSGGSGYTSTPTISVVAPPEVGVGVGTTATATATISAGAVSSILVNNPGLGYTIAPQVIVSLPSPTYENISSIDIIQGFSGIVTGITTVNAQGIGTLAIQFNLHRLDEISNYNGLAVGYPIYIYDTSVGNGVTSVANNDLSVVGVGTTFVDNIYFIQEISNVGVAGSIICYVNSGTPVVGIATTSNSSNPVGRFSWGRFAGISRSSSPVSIAVTGNTVDVGLTTFPTIQRRGTGLRDGGALPKNI